MYVYSLGVNVPKGIYYCKHHLYWAFNFFLASDCIEETDNRGRKHMDRNGKFNGESWMHTNMPTRHIMLEKDYL